MRGWGGVVRDARRECRGGVEEGKEGEQLRWWVESMLEDLKDLKVIRGRRWTRWRWKLKS